MEFSEGRKRVERLSKGLEFVSNKNETKTAPQRAIVGGLGDPLGDLRRKKSQREAKERERKGRHAKGEEKGFQEWIATSWREGRFNHP